MVAETENSPPLCFQENLLTAGLPDDSNLNAHLADWLLHHGTSYQHYYLQRGNYADNMSVNIKTGGSKPANILIHLLLCQLLK